MLLLVFMNPCITSRTPFIPLYRQCVALPPTMTGQSLGQGFADFEAYRSDVIFLCAFYAMVGRGLLPSVTRHRFHAAAVPVGVRLRHHRPGFAALGLYEMSRRREQGAEVELDQCLGHSEGPSAGRDFGTGLGVDRPVFLVWLAAAWLIFDITLGTKGPADLGPFLNAVFFTTPGVEMIALGLAVGFCFASLAMMMSVVSFPLLVDRDVLLDTSRG